jgi:hypothetical protein
LQCSAHRVRRDQKHDHEIPDCPVTQPRRVTTTTAYCHDCLLPRLLITTHSLPPLLTATITHDHDRLGSAVHATTIAKIIALGIAADQRPPLLFVACPVYEPVSPRQPPFNKTSFFNKCSTCRNIDEAKILIRHQRRPVVSRPMSHGRHLRCISRHAATAAVLSRPAAPSIHSHCA